MSFVSQKVIDGKTYTLFREDALRTKDYTPKEWVEIDEKGKEKKVKELKVKAKAIWNDHAKLKKL